MNFYPYYVWVTTIYLCLAGTNISWYFILASAQQCMVKKGNKDINATHTQCLWTPRAKFYKVKRPGFISLLMIFNLNCFKNEIQTFSPTVPFYGFITAAAVEDIGSDFESRSRFHDTTLPKLGTDRTIHIWFRHQNLRF